MASLAAPDALEALAAAVPAATLSTETATLDLVAHDVYARGLTPLALFRPTSIEQLAAGIGAATRAGLAIVPRGGGMSYTGGYLCPHERCILIDTGALDRVVAINQADMTVTVEAGCSWAKLREALHPLGLRALAWGTLSGIHATVGGGMSQNGVFWGASRGTVAEGAIAFDMVLADGSIMSTGSSFFRPYGPDLTGLFAADCGALGVKARVTLKLLHEGQAFAHGSFAFDDHRALFAAMSGVAREGLASECFGFDPYLQAQRMKRESLTSDARSLLTMMKAQGSAWKAIKEGASVIAAGRSFLDGVPFSLHMIAEGRHQAAVDGDMDAIGRIVAEAGGRAIDNTIPKILRANPFPPVNSMVGPDGERWVPVHGFLPHSRLVEAWEAIQALYAAHEGAMTALGVNAGAMLAAVNAQCCLIEPVFFWPEALNPLHRHAVEPGHLAKLKGFVVNPEASALVHELRAGIVRLFHERGAAHLQVARTYPLHDSHDPAAWALLRAVKAAVDPAGLMNPGALGL